MNQMVEWHGDPDEDTPYVLASDYDALVAYAELQTKALQEIVALNRRVMFERCPDCVGVSCGTRKECAIVPLDKHGTIAQAALDANPSPSQGDQRGHAKADEKLNDMAYNAACAEFPGDPAARHCFMKGYKWACAIAENAIANTKSVTAALSKEGVLKSVGYQYAFHGAWRPDAPNRIVWRDSNAEYNGHRCIGHREIFAGPEKLNLEGA